MNIMALQHFIFCYTCWFIINKPEWFQLVRTACFMLTFSNTQDTHMHMHKSFQFRLKEKCGKEVAECQFLKNDASSFKTCSTGGGVESK